jgi:hypothetical protein
MDLIDHVGMCSPCYKEYDAMRRQRRWILFGAMVAWLCDIFRGKRVSSGAKTSDIEGGMAGK